MRPIFRYLRIAFSAGCGALCLLLVALWMRSYWRCDILENTNNSEVIHLESRKGFLIYQVLHPNFKRTFPAPLRVAILNDPSLGRFFSSYPYPVAESYRFPVANALSGFGSFRSGSTTIMFAPHWFAVSLLATFAAMPWFRWRFSLRTMLIAMTLIAALLSITAILTRR